MKNFKRKLSQRPKWEVKRIKPLIIKGYPQIIGKEFDVFGTPRVSHIPYDSLSDSFKESIDSIEGNPYPEKSCDWWVWRVREFGLRNELFDNIEGATAMTYDCLGTALDYHLDWLNLPEGEDYWFNIISEARSGNIELR